MKVFLFQKRKHFSDVGLRGAALRGESRGGVQTALRGPPGTDPLPDNIIFETTSYASNVPFIGTMTQDDIIDSYYIEISAATSTINQFDNTTFELQAVYPNPVMNQAKVQFISGLNADIVFKIYNLLGEEIESQLISSSRGVNTVNLNTSSYSEGIYLYSINNGNKVLTKRMVVKK